MNILVYMLLEMAILTVYDTLTRTGVNGINGHVSMPLNMVILTACSMPKKMDVQNNKYFFQYFFK
jgi:hypothetical protein